MQCIFTAGQGYCTVQSEPGAEVNLFTSSAEETKEQWERWKEHRDRTYYQPRGLLTDIQDSLDSEVVHAASFAYAETETKVTPHTAYLLIVAQLIVENDAIGLLWLRPWQCEAIHGGADLVHDVNYGWGCKKQKELHETSMSI